MAHVDLAELRRSADTTDSKGAGRGIYFALDYEFAIDPRARAIAAATQDEFYLLAERDTASMRRGAPLATKKRALAA